MPVGCARVGVWAESSVSRGESNMPRGATHAAKIVGRKALTQKRMSRQNRQRVAGGAGAAACRGAAGRQGCQCQRHDTGGTGAQTQVLVLGMKILRVGREWEADRELILAKGNLVIHVKKGGGWGRARGGGTGGNGNLPSWRVPRAGRGARQKISLREDCRQTVKTVKGGCRCRSLQGWVGGRGEREGASGTQAAAGAAGGAKQRAWSVPARGGAELLYRGGAPRGARGCGCHRGSRVTRAGR